MTIENSFQKTPQYKGLFDFLKSNPTEQDCVDYYEEIGKRKGEGKMPASPFDKTSKVYKCSKGGGFAYKEKVSFSRYRCKNTGKYFNVKTGTELENTKISMRDGLISVYLFASQKKGISSCQLAKYINVSQPSALFVLHRLRDSSKLSPLSPFKEKLEGIVEVDETFIGGKNANRHGDKKVPNSQGRSGKDKIPVLVMIKKGGRAIAQVVPNTQLSTLLPIIRANVKEGSTIYTDDGYRHSNLSQNFNHQGVNHGKRQYVNGKVSVNSAENFNSHLKGTIRTHHWISRKHAQKYLNEMVVRGNTRNYKEHERFDLVLSSTFGKRLTYRQLIS